MARFQACLLDAFGTIVSTDFSGHRAELPALAGIPADAMYTEFARLAPALTVGELSMAEAFEQILRACGVEPAPSLVRALADRSRELVLAAGLLYDDALPFLRTLWSLGVRTAIVSNCDENTRPMLGELGVTALVDTLVLSCEVGAAKPDAKIYRAALDQLGVAADDTVFIDDNAEFCAAAAALGISAVQIVRSGSDGQAGVRSLHEAEAIIEGLDDRGRSSRCARENGDKPASNGATPR